MTEKNKMPYIGMSGVVNTEQQAQLEAYVNDLGLYDASRKFAYCAGAPRRKYYPRLYRRFSYFTA